VRQSPNCASQMAAGAVAVGVGVGAAATAVATAATASPTRYERTLRKCARELSDFASCTEPGAVWDDVRFREWAREHRTEATKQAGRFVARLLRDKAMNQSVGYTVRLHMAAWKAYGVSVEEAVLDELSRLTRETLASRSGIRVRAQARETSCCCPRCPDHWPLHSRLLTCATRCCAVSSERGPVARCESAAKVHDQSTGAATPLEPHGNGTSAVRHEARTRARERAHPTPCSRQPHRAARRLSSCRLAGGSPCRAGALRRRAPNVTARPSAAAALPRPCWQNETQEGKRAKRRRLPCGMVASAVADRLIALIRSRLLHLRRAGASLRARCSAADCAVLRCWRALVSELSEEGADQEAAGAEQADWCRLLRFPKVLQVAA
jgi:hypothetical protein